GGFSAVRLALCRRLEPLPLSRLVDLVHGCNVLLVITIVTAGSDWIAVILGADRGSWSTVTPALVGALGIFTAGLALGALGLISEIRRMPTFDRAGPAGPDWLADATRLANRLSQRVGPLEPVGTAIVRAVD